jgi:hypothetical protein
MADGRKRSAAKQARRDARRRKAQRGAEREAPQDAPLIGEVRQALDDGQPLDLLGLVSMVIVATAQHQSALSPQPDAEELLSLAELVSAFIDVQVPETTALLAVLGELVVDDEMLRDRCRRAVASRNDPLPGWLTGLAQTTVHRVVRMMHALGDGDEVLLGVRLADGQELTCAVNIDHLMMSEVADAFFVPETISTVLDVATASNTDSDISFVDLDLADARAELQQALDKHLSMFPLEDSDTWPSCRALVQWLTRLMPAGGSALQAAQQDSVQESELLERFFASAVGRPFDDADHRELLARCIEAGTGDPLRWSAERLRQLLYSPVADHEDIALGRQLDVPELLRVFVPFAHAESGIRQGLTAEALAAIDEVADDYRAEVLAEAEAEDEDDDA